METYAVKILDIADDLLEDLLLLIDKERIYKIKKYINKKDKIRTIIGEILVKTIASNKLNININSLFFDRDIYGKPTLKGYPKFNFNISHSGNYVVCAIDDNPIGIDIEKTKTIDYKEIAKSFFSASEFDYIMKKDSNSQLSTFYEIWTLKESYIKCCGQGLSIPLNSFSIDINHSGNIKVIVGGKHKDHIFKTFHTDELYKISVCSVNKKITSDIIMLDQNKLIHPISSFKLT